MSPSAGSSYRCRSACSRASARFIMAFTTGRSSRFAILSKRARYTSPLSGDIVPFNCSVTNAAFNIWPVLFSAEAFAYMACECWSAVLGRSFSIDLSNVFHIVA